MICLPLLTYYLIMALQARIYCIIYQSNLIEGPNLDYICIFHYQGCIMVITLVIVDTKEIWFRKDKNVNFDQKPHFELKRPGVSKDHNVDQFWLFLDFWWKLCKFHLPCMSSDNQIRLKMSQNEKEVLDHLECLNSSSKMQNSKTWRVIS